MSNLMKTLTIGDASYEICDASARETLKNTVKSINGATPDENGNIEVEVGSGSGGGVSSWNDLTDKPFGEEQIVLDIHWDGELADRIYIEDVSSDIKGYFVHVSDCTSKEAVVGATLGYMEIADDGTTTEGTIVLTENFCIPYGEATMIGEAHALIVPYDNFDLMGMGVFIFPKAGIYFTKREGMVTVTSLVGESTVVHKLDKKYTNNPVVVNITYTYNEETDEYTDITSDVGYNEIADAYKNGSPVFVCETGDNMFRYPAIIMGSEYQEMIGAYLQFGVIYTQGNVSRAIAMFNPLIDEDIQMFTMPAVSSLPEITTENNGQILGVADGVWGVMDAPSGLPEAGNEGAFLRIVDGVPTWVVLENAEDGVY